VTTFLYVLYAFFGLGVICLILACTGWAETPIEPPACETCSDPSGMGRCDDCPVFCGHRLCRGRRTEARWTGSDMDVLAGDLTSIKREGQW
jgi:hypothetical protein